MHTIYANENKELLLIDLCGRLPYGVKISFDNSKTEVLWHIKGVDKINSYPIEHIKPYLRPMSSMTDEELKEFGRLKHRDNEDWEIVEMWVVKHDFLNIKCRHKHHEDSTGFFQVSRTEPLWKIVFILQKPNLIIGNTQYLKEWKLLLRMGK